VKQFKQFILVQLTEPHLAKAKMHSLVFFFATIKLHLQY